MQELGVGPLQPGVPRSEQEGLAPPPRPCRAALAPGNCPAHQKVAAIHYLGGWKIPIHESKLKNERISLFF